MLFDGRRKLYLLSIFQDKIELPISLIKNMLLFVIIGVHATGKSICPVKIAITKSNLYCLWLIFAIFINGKLNKELFYSEFINNGIRLWSKS